MISIWRMRMKSKIQHDFYDKKYTLIFHENGRLTALRYNEEWRDLTGDGLVLAMLQEFDELSQRYANLEAEYLKLKISG